MVSDTGGLSEVVRHEETGLKVYPAMQILWDGE